MNVLWTSCVDQLPPDKGWYMVWKNPSLGNDDEGPQIAYYSSREWKTHRNGRYIGGVSHWCDYDVPDVLTTIPSRANITNEAVKDAVENFYEAYHQLQVVLALTYEGKK